jgi:hypothetical protein
MSGAFAIFERDFRKFLKSPVMMFMTLLFPLFYLIILGNAIGGTIHHIPIGMTQTDLFYGETQEFQTTLEAIQQTDLFDVTIYPSEEIAKRDLAEGRIYAAAVFPADRNDANTIRVYIDSSDSFVPPLIENGFSGIVHGLGISRVVESYQIYGKVEYLQFFGVAILVMSIFMTSMMGGGNALIRDRERDHRRVLCNSCKTLKHSSWYYYEWISASHAHLITVVDCGCTGGRGDHPKPRKFPPCHRRALADQCQYHEFCRFFCLTVPKSTDVRLHSGLFQFALIHDQRCLLPDNCHARLAPMDNRH